MTVSAGNGAAGGRPLRIDRDASAQRIAEDVTTLSGPQYTSSPTAICRYAYTPEYRRTVRWFAQRFGELGYEAREDPVGNLIAQREPDGTPVFGVGSHCDSNRNGGPWDGTLGVVIALELCRLADEHGIDVPLRVISFLEEEASGFGQLLLGSRACAGDVSEIELREQIRALDDGRPFFDHAVDAGLHPEQWRECRHAFDDMRGWIECHIEQGRVLEDAGERLGVVDTIAGCVHADIRLRGRADHAGATPMNLRVDAMAVAAEVTLELERLAVDRGGGTVGAVGELDIDPGLINVVPGATRLSLDIRGTDDAAFMSVARDIEAFAGESARRRGASAEYRERHTTPATAMDPGLVAALRGAAAATGEPYRVMPSGAVHDTVNVARSGVATAMLFVPCAGGISHAPDESADPADAAVACEAVLNVLASLA